MSRTDYDSEFFGWHEAESRKSAEKMLPVVLELIRPRSILDIGCGLGTWLSVAQKLGVTDVIGVDGHYIDCGQLQIHKDLFLPHDLTLPFDLGRKFELVISLEVAEHIERASSDIFLANLVRHGAVIVFSAAVPGQGGVHHVNEQWPAYWAHKFADLGYLAADCLRRRIWDDDQISFWYRQNAIVFVEKTHFERTASFRAEAWNTTLAPMSVVHPELLRLSSAQPLTMGRIIRELPGAIKRSASVRAARLLGKTRR